MKIFKMIIVAALIMFTTNNTSAKEVLEGPYPAVVERVFDGDTFEAKIKVWLGQEVVTRVRLRDIDTPEMRGKCASEKELARRAKDSLERLTEGQPIILTNITFGKYGNRIIANAHVGSNNISELMIRSGLAQHYKGGKRQNWCT